MPQIDPASQPAITPPPLSQQSPLNPHGSTSEVGKEIAAAYGAIAPSEVPMKDSGLSGNPMATTWQLKTPTPTDIIKKVLQKEDKQIHPYLLQYSFDDKGHRSIEEFARHIEQHGSEPDWAEELKFLPDTETPDKVIELFTENSERIATLYNHHYLSQEQKLALENHLGKLDYEKIKTLWNGSFSDPGYELMRLLVNTNTAKKIMKAPVVQSALEAVIKNDNGTLLGILQRIDTFPSNPILKKQRHSLTESQYLIHWATKNKSKNIFEVLLQDPRVNSRMKSLKEGTPYQIAERYGFRQLENMLLDRSEKDFNE